VLQARHSLAHAAGAQAGEVTAMTFPARSARSGKRLSDLMRQYAATLSQVPEYQDGIQMSEVQIATREIEDFIAWLEDNDHE
jgi:hypothetical protein